MVEVGMEQPRFPDGIPTDQTETLGIYASVMLPVSSLFQVRPSFLGDPGDGVQGFVGTLYSVEDGTGFHPITISISAIDGEELTTRLEAVSTIGGIKASGLLMIDRNEFEHPPLFNGQAICSWCAQLRTVRIRP